MREFLRMQTQGNLAAMWVAYFLSVVAMIVCLVTGSWLALGVQLVFVGISCYYGRRAGRWGNYNERR